MPLKAKRPCSTPGCGKPATTGGKCDTHKRQQQQHSDQRRGNATERGYGTKHRQRFRKAVLERDGYQCQACGGFDADTADHHPYSRRQLVEMNEDPDDPRWGRALHAHCHNAHTGRTQGWMATQGTPPPDAPPPF